MIPDYLLKVLRQKFLKANYYFSGLVNNNYLLTNSDLKKCYELVFPSMVIQERDYYSLFPSDKWIDCRDLSGVIKFLKEKNNGEDIRQVEEAGRPDTDTGSS